MLKKIKNILGIEGVKIQLISPPEVSKNDKRIKGRVILTSQSKKHIKSLSIKLIEKYKRGRAEATLINEYVLSDLDLELNIDIDKSTPAKLDFDLPLNLLKSDMDQIADKNFITNGLVKVAKKLKNVQSFYRLEATAHIDGTSLDAIDGAPIVLT